jgi:hypothetical protein
MRSASATEVPPNFITTVSGKCRTIALAPAGPSVGRNKHHVGA